MWKTLWISSVETLSMLYHRFTNVLTILLQQAAAVQLHSVLKAIQIHLTKILEALKRMNEQYNPLIQRTQQEDVTIDNEDVTIVDEDVTTVDFADVCNERENNLIQNAFIIIMGVLFIIVAIRCIWSSVKVENKILEDIQVAEKETLEDENCAELKELHSRLVFLKDYLSNFPDREAFQSSSNITRDTSGKPISRSLYSNVTNPPNMKKDAEKQENLSHLRENLQRALRILERQIDQKSNITGDTADGPIDFEIRSKTEKDDSMVRNRGARSKDYEPVNQCTCTDHTNMSSRLQFTHQNVASYLLQKLSDGTSLVTDDADTRKQLGTCRDCLTARDVLLLLQQHLEIPSCKTNELADSRGENRCKGCSETNGVQNSLALKLWNSAPPPPRKTPKCSCACRDGRDANRKTGEPLNVTARNNSLNIEILFNRNIHLK